MERIVGGTPQDYEEIVKLSNICFPEDAGVAEQRWCHVWGGHLPAPSQEYMGNFLLAKINGTLAGQLAICPMVLEWDGERIQVGGISAVCTHPDYRNRGIMSRLLQNADEIMRKRGDVISVLQGDRFRYSNFGWEPVGSYVQLTYGGKYLGRLPEMEEAPHLIDHRDLDMVDRLLTFYNIGNPRFVRTREHFQVLLQRKGVRFWAQVAKGTTGGALESYIGTRDGVIHEFGGSPEYVLALIKSFAEIYERTAVSVSCRLGELAELLYSHASKYSIHPLFCMKILRLSQLLRTLKPAVQRNRRDSICRSGSVGDAWDLTLEIEESGEAVTLLVNQDVCDLSSRPSRHVLRLSSRKMARLLFGPFSHGLLKSTRPDGSEEYMASGGKSDAGDGTLGSQSVVFDRLLGIFPLPIACSCIDLV